MTSDNRTSDCGSTSAPTKISAASIRNERKSVLTQLNSLINRPGQISSGCFNQLIIPLYPSEQADYATLYYSAEKIHSPEDHHDSTDTITALIKSQERQKDDDIRQRAMNRGQSGGSFVRSSGGTSLGALTEEPGTMDDESPNK